MDMKFETIEDFPEWAVTFAAYNDMDGLTDDDINEVVYWMSENGFSRLVSTEDDRHFSSHPAFGLACDTVTATFE